MAEQLPFIQHLSPKVKASLARLPRMSLSLCCVKVRGIVPSQQGLLRQHGTFQLTLSLRPLLLCLRVIRFADNSAENCWLCHIQKGEREDNLYSKSIIIKQTNKITIATSLSYKSSSLSCSGNCNYYQFPRNS